MKFPRYPIYIISKGRYQNNRRYTSKALEKLKCPYFIAVEQHEYENYSQTIDQNYGKVLSIPISNHGDGPGLARNWCWDHSISMGFDRHWVFDDNITGFYRLHNNERVLMNTPSFFAAAEDFIDRYENIPISGFQYRMFVAPNAKYPPYVTNTRIYSCLLIDNKCKHRWRGRYNEDTDLSLRVLKDGDVTLQFNIFLQDKMGTQQLKGGNTDEFYSKQGTKQKSQMLVDLHPDCSKLVKKYNRWHHYVDYRPFKNNIMKLKEGLVLKNEVNEYGMKLIEVKK